MRVSIFILVALLSWSGFAGPAAAAPRVAEDGQTLVLEGAGKDAQKGEKSEDTLYQLLGQEVQVYIFNSKTRVWPQVYVRSAPGTWSTRGWSSRSLTPRDPRVDALIQKYAIRYGVDPTLVRAVMRHESGFNAGAVSPKGAQGLMQLMPGTADLMGVRDPFDPEQNIAGGVGYLRHCLDRFQHNVPLAVAAYNAGPERVAKCGTIPPIEETQVFVHNVMGTYGGPDQKGGNPGAPAAKGPPPSGKPAAAQAAQSKEAPHRPKAKIIEVRSLKKLPREAASDSDSKQWQ